MSETRMKQMNIYQKINTVMKSVSYIKKDTMVQTYKAVSHDAVVAHCRKAFVDNGIVVYPIQTGEGVIAPVIKADGSISNMIRYQAKYCINFVNIDDPQDRIEVFIEAHSNDNGDKAPGKAVTYATKSAILKVLSLETGTDDESRMTDQEVEYDDIHALESCTSMDDLQRTFTGLFSKYKGKKDLMKEIVSLKDEMKGRLNATG